MAWYTYLNCFVLYFCMFNQRCICITNNCRNVSKTLYVVNGGNASTDFYSDAFINLGCFFNNVMIFNTKNFSESSNFHLWHSNKRFTIVITNITMDMNKTYNCRILESLCAYYINITFKIMDEALIETPSLRTELQPCQTPEPITSIHISNVTNTSLVIGWKWNASISDCSETVFVVESFSPIPRIWSELIVIENNSSTDHTLEIQQLMPATMYGFVLFTRNSVGQSRSFIFGSTKDYTFDLCPVSPQESHWPNRTVTGFSMTKTASIAFAFLAGFLSAGCAFYLKLCLLRKRKKKLHGHLDVNYQTSIITQNTRNPVSNQSQCTAMDRPANEYNMTSSKYATIIHRSTPGDADDGRVCGAGSQACSVSHLSKTCDIDAENNTYHAIGDPDLVYHSVV